MAHAFVAFPNLSKLLKSRDSDKIKKKES